MSFKGVPIGAELSDDQVTEILKQTTINASKIKIVCKVCRQFDKFCL